MDDALRKLARDAVDAAFGEAIKRRFDVLETALIAAPDKDVRSAGGRFANGLKSLVEAHVLAKQIIAN